MYEKVKNDYKINEMFSKELKNVIKFKILRLKSKVKKKNEIKNAITARK